MKVLHIAQPTTAGVAVIVERLVHMGLTQGDHVTVACPSGGDLAARAEAAGALWVRLEMSRRPALTDVITAIRVRRLMRCHDVTVAHSSKAGAVARLARLTLFRCVLVFVPHGWSWLVGGRMGHLYRAFETATRNLATVSVAVGKDEFDTGRRVLRGHSRLRLIENGVDVLRFSRDGVRAARGSNPLVIQVGRLTHQKGQDLAVRALALLEDRTVQLRLVGGGECRQLQQLAIELGVGHRVEFIGETDPAPHLRAADVALFPSRWEGLSLALLEAMSSGVPVVASSAAGGAALGDAGVQIDLDDEDRFVQELAGSLDRLLRDEGDRQLLGCRARERAVGFYSYERMLSEYSRLLAEVANAR